MLIAMSRSFFVTYDKNVRMHLAAHRGALTGKYEKTGEAKPCKANLCERKRNWNYRSSTVLFGKLNKEAWAVKSAFQHYLYGTCKYLIV